MKKKIKKPKKKIGMLPSISLKGVKYSNREIEAASLPKPIAPLNLVEHIRLPLKENIKSNIDLDLTPYLRLPIKCIGNFGVETIIVIAPTQSGKSIILQVAVGYAIDQDPGPLLYIYPDEITAKKSLQEKIIDMILETPQFKKHIISVRKVSKLGIALDTMTIFPAWSNSPLSINAFPKKWVLWDEARLMKLTVGRESNAIKLGEDRMTTYRSLGIAQGIMVSSPSVEGDLLHQQLDVAGTQILVWNSRCPDCGEYQVLDFFDNVKRADTKDGSPRCLCKLCGAPFSDEDRKVSWNGNGVYAPEGHIVTKDEAEGYEGGLIKGITLGKRVVFRWDSCVSPFRSFKQIREEFEKTKSKPHDYRNFIQCWCAKFWKQGVSKNSVDTLKNRKCEYKLGYVPKGVKILLGGIDTQDDCLYYVVYGFGLREQCWLIDEGRIPCDIDITNADDLEEIVANHIVNNRYLSMENNEEWKTALICWDSGGHRTKEVYSVVSRIPQLLAIKGRNNQNRSIQYSENETHYNIRTEEYLSETEERAGKEDFHLPSDVSFDFLCQFINKRKVMHQHGRTGKKSMEWISTGPDHLRLASAYCFACLDIPMGRQRDFRSKLRENDFKLNPFRKTAPTKSNRDQNDVPGDTVDEPFTLHAKARMIREENDYW